ncbi:MAG TPA: hypothetical protein VMU89_19645 [Thermomicrobiaceae bacterium]|nr:hypothetical protein [Thermomicrobiaceae bacterium]
MHPNGTCPVCGAELRADRAPETLSSREEPATDGAMRLASFLNGTPWRDELRTDPPPGHAGPDLSWLKW